MKTLFKITALMCLLATPAIAAERAPLTAAEEATMSDPRNAFEVSYANAEEVITEALTEKGVGDKVLATMNGNKTKPVFVYSKPITVQTRGLKFDKATGHWEASLLFVSDGDVVSAIPASGHFDEMVEVAVLKREMRSSDVIHDSDIEIRDISVGRTRADTITDFSGLIGKTPVRSISPFRPIRSEEVETPAIMKKDAMVQMHYTAPGMEITTSGQALAGGAKGDIINVRNDTSKKVIRAVIEDSNDVSIVAIGDQHAQN